jgi:hypothetical protein
LDATINTGVSKNAYLGDLRYSIGNLGNVSVAKLKVISHSNWDGSTPPSGLIDYAPLYSTDHKYWDYAFDQFAAGASFNIGQLNLGYEYVKNNTNLPTGAQRWGYKSSLTWNIPKSKGNYGSYIGIEYLSLGNWATDSTYWKIGLWVPGGDGIGRDGAKGWGFVSQYAYAPNANLQFRYHVLKPYDPNYWV